MRQHNSCSDNTARTGKLDYRLFIRKLYKLLPLFVRQIRSIPLRCSAIRASSQNDSRMLKSHSGDISKQAILLRDAYSSACLAVTCRLKAKCSLFPTSTFGTPGACYENLSNKKSTQRTYDLVYLFHFFQPPVNSVKTPFVRNIVDEYNALCTTRIRSYYRAETSLTGRIPQLQFNTFAIQQYCRCLVCYSKKEKYR